MKQSIWISYDLGIKGDYPGLYRWLDSHKAKECGNIIAFLSYEYKSNLIKEIIVDLKKAIEFKNGDRVYIVYTESKEGKQHSLGRFIVGNRKSSPWFGYAPMDENIPDT